MNRKEIQEINPKLIKEGMLGAIRLFCLECMGGDKNEIRYCTDKTCPLYRFRFGTVPAKPKEDK